MKRILLLIVGLLCLPLVFGDIGIDTVYEDSFLGDNLGLKVTLVPDIDVDAIFSSTLDCSSGSLQYFSKPVSLTAGKTLTIRVPALQAYLTGECGVVARLARLNGELIEDTRGNSFRIESVLDLVASLDTEVVQPGDVVTLSGSVTRGGEAVTDAVLTVTFQGTEQEISVSSGKFSEKITVSESAQSGKHGLLVNAHDSFGNVQETRVELVVQGMASQVKQSATALNAVPGDTLGVLVLLLDQAGTLLHEDLTIQLFKERALRDDIILFSKVVASDSTFDFVIDNTMAPGEYVLQSSFADLKHVDIFTIEEVSSIESSFEGKLLTLVNTGNVPYANDASITLVSESEVFVLQEKLKLDVNEQKVIDLSESAPSGSYEALVTEEPLTEDEAETLLQRRQAGNSITGMSVAQGEVVANAVDVDYDRRGFLQKVGDTTSSFFAPTSFSFRPYLYIALGIAVFLLLTRYLKGKGKGGSTEISHEKIAEHIKEHATDAEKKE